MPLDLAILDVELQDILALLGRPFHVCRSLFARSRYKEYQPLVGGLYSAFPVIESGPALFSPNREEGEPLTPTPRAAIVVSVRYGGTTVGRGRLGP